MQLVKNTTEDMANCTSAFLVLFLIKEDIEALVKQIGPKTRSDFIKTFTDPHGVLGCPVTIQTQSDWFKNSSGSQTYLRDLSISHICRG